MFTVLSKCEQKSRLCIFLFHVEQNKSVNPLFFMKRGLFFLFGVV